MALFAEGFLRLVWNTMPNQFLGSKECVYQAYVCAFMTAAGKLIVTVLQKVRPNKPSKFPQVQSCFATGFHIGRSTKNLLRWLTSSSPL